MEPSSRAGQLWEEPKPEQGQLLQVQPGPVPWPGAWFGPEPLSSLALSLKLGWTAPWASFEPGPGLHLDLVRTLRLGLGLCLGLWPGQPKTLGNASTGVLPKFGVGDVGKLFELVADSLWDCGLTFLWLDQGLDSS